MALEQKVFTGADGAAATTANTGYGSLFATAPETIVHEASRVFRDAASSVRVTATTANTALYGSFTVDSTSSLGWDQPFMAEMMPTAGNPGIAEFIASGTTRNLQLELLPTGALRLKNAQYVTVGETPAGVIAANVPVVPSLFYTGSATVGTLTLRVWNEDEETLRTPDIVLSGIDTRGATTLIRSIAAKTRTATTAGVYLWGEPRWDTAATGLLAPWAAPSTMTALRASNGTAYEDFDLRYSDGTTWHSVLTG